MDTPKINPETILLTKEALVCPSCGTLFAQFAGVTPGHSQIVRKSQLWVCAHCSNLSIVGDSALENVSEEKFRELPRHVQESVSAIIQTIRDTSVTDRRN